MPELQQPNIVGNFLQSYYGAQDRTRQQAADQMQTQRLQKQDMWAEEDRQHQQALEKQGEVARQALAADTPEKWEALRAQVKQTSGVDLPGFDQRDAVINAVQSLPDIIKQRVDARKLALDEKQTNAQIGLISAQTAALRAKPTGSSALAQSASERAQLAQALGIDPHSDAGKRYILTGQMPNGLTPADRNAVQEADQKVLATKQGLGMLQQARKLSDQSNQGYGANTLAQVPALLGDKSSLNTIDFDNLLQAQVLPQLKTIFGGAPTEGERAILLQLQGSSTLSRENRNRILDRAIQMAAERLKFYDEQSQGIRGGTYYNPGQGPLAVGQPAPAAAAPVAAPAATKAPPPPPGFKVIQ